MFIFFIRDMLSPGGQPAGLVFLEKRRKREKNWGKNGEKTCIVTKRDERGTSCANGRKTRECARWETQRGSREGDAIRRGGEHLKKRAIIWD